MISTSNTLKHWFNLINLKHRMIIEREWSQGHWIQKLFITLDSSAQDHSNDIKIIKIEQVKPIKNSFESV